MASKALDYATRKAITDTVGEILRAEIRSSALNVDTVPVPQLHGPCSPGVELFVIGAVLCGHVSALDLGLAPDEFWAQRHRRVWTVLLAAAYPCAECAAAACVEAEVFPDLKQAEALLGDWSAIAGASVALRDVAAAVVLLRRQARDRRTVRLLASLADGICNGAESHGTAYEQLREHFASERSKATR